MLFPAAGFEPVASANSAISTYFGIAQNSVREPYPQTGRWCPELAPLVLPSCLGSLADYFSGEVAGMTGFEPVNAGVKVPCLTAWLHPNMIHRPILR